MLFAGTNYHPHDWAETRWEKDIALMKDAGMTVVRLGHLCWDSFEPQDGVFTFEWFDRVMDAFQAADMQVVLDVATRPAPLWLHAKDPFVTVTDAHGRHQRPHTRYMEDVGHSGFQNHALRFAKALACRYQAHPALFAFGLCNELGAGFVSCSAAVEQRFRDWLGNKYGSIDALNRAWSGHRWSRRHQSFEDVFLPVSTVSQVSPERMLDLERFHSDEIIAYMGRLREVIRNHAPHAREVTNHWSENGDRGFDYLKAYRTLIDLPGAGFYPGINPEDTDAVIGACLVMTHRIAESDAPIWCVEFQTGTFGGYACPPGAMRMYAWLCLLYRSQAAIAWTWRSMLGGEEQYLFGLLDHDGELSRKYAEFKTIAEDYRLLSSLGLPRRIKPEIGLAYSYESLKVSRHSKSQYRTGYVEQLLQVFKALFRRNLDCNVIDLRDIQGEYALIIVPGHVMMDPESARNLREYVRGGGTVVMTACSAKVNEHNQVFDTPQPGLLEDVFGIRANGFERNRTHVGDVNEGGLEKKNPNLFRYQVSVRMGEKTVSPGVDYYEILELKTAQCLAVLTGLPETLPAVSFNRYGAGTAIYTAIPAAEDLTDLLLAHLCEKLGLDRGLPTPEGVAARRIGEMDTLYVNTTAHTVEIALPCSARSMLDGQRHGVECRLAPYGVDCLRDEQ